MVKIQIIWNDEIGKHHELVGVDQNILNIKAALKFEIHQNFYVATDAYIELINDLLILTYKLEKMP
jgi:hypothetical protein